MNTELINVALKGVTELATSILSNPVLVWGGIVILALGYFFKLMPFYPNNYIPFGTVVGGTLFYAFYLNPAIAPQYSIDPRATLGSIGFVMSLLVWALHRTVFKKWIDDKIWKADGNTDIITKDEKKP